MKNRKEGKKSKTKWKLFWTRVKEFRHYFQSVHLNRGMTLTAFTFHLYIVWSRGIFLSSNSPARLSSLSSSFYEVVCKGELRKGRCYEFQNVKLRIFWLIGYLIILGILSSAVYATPLPFNHFVAATLDPRNWGKCIETQSKCFLYSVRKQGGNNYYTWYCILDFFWMIYFPPFHAQLILLTISPTSPLYLLTPFVLL